MKEQPKKTRITLDEALNIKGQTQWAKLISEERSANKKTRPVQK